MLRGREEFAAEKGIQFAAQQSGNLLYTLIPPDVAARSHSLDGAMLARDIPCVTVMFCTLERQEELQREFSEEVFDLLGRTFADLDDAVQEHGMYKYQHVGVCAPSLFAREPRGNSAPPSAPDFDRLFSTHRQYMS